SLVDNFPNTCIEAMSVGQIIVGSRQGSFDELITDGVNGFIASTDSSAEFTAQIQRALQLDPAERARMSDAIKARCRDFSEEKAISALVAFYHRAIRKRRLSHVRTK